MNLKPCGMAVKDKSSFLIRTYERGVEEETSACGTGISACAICTWLYKNASSPVKFTTIDGDQLKVEVSEDKPLTKVYLTGLVCEVFTGNYHLFLPQPKKFSTCFFHFF